MSKHEDFILTSMMSIINEAHIALPTIRDGIETRAVCDYILQALFLKLTGFQEQKMKCIAWELATDNYDYRRGKFKNVSQSECSSIVDKQHIIYEMVRQCKEEAPTYSGPSDAQLTGIISSSKQAILGLFKDTILESWDQRHLDDFERFSSSFTKDYVIGSEALFTTITKEIKDGNSSLFNHVYVQRNRCAHNTLSYQQNLPKLERLAEQKFAHDNYCILIFILLVLDQFVVEIYKNYKALTSDFEV